MKRRRRVLFLNQGRGWSSSGRGVVVARQAFQAGLEEIENDAYEVSFAEVPPFNRAQRLVVSPVPGLTNRQDLRALRYGVMRSAAGRFLLEKELRRTRPDAAIVSTAQIALVLGRLQRRLPYVLTCDIPILDWSMMQRKLAVGDPEPADLQVFAHLERRAFTNAPVCVAWTDHVADRIRSIAPKATVEVIHPGIDVRRYRPRSSTRRDGPVRVLFVGGRWNAKGGPLILEALGDRLGADVELHVVSPHDATGPGIVARGTKATPEIFQSADIFCMPTRQDGAPMVIAEALACGLPVVSTAVSSIPSMVGSTRGRVVPRGDVDALRSTLLELVESSSLRAEMGDAARTWAEERYDVRKNTRRLLALVGSVAANGSRHDSLC